ncbi:MAG: aminoglycoside adenylyltransferase family protein [Bordetella sp.]|nr:aminoglycoside adenylyltransferase family protein [Bordetella sp.]
MNPALPAAIAGQLAQTRRLLEQHLGADLLALHLFGSATDGGLRPASDIDLLATVRAPLAPAARLALMRALLSVSAWPRTDPALRALEVTVLVRDDVVPWRHPARRELQFGEWLRDDILAGRIEAADTDPDLAILLRKARSHGVALLGPAASVWFEPVPQRDFVQALRDTIAQWRGLDDWLGDELTVVLALARIWYSAATGAIASKDVAADWALARLPDSLRPVMAQARAAYLGDAPDELARDPAALQAFVPQVRAEIERLLPPPSTTGTP